MCDFDYYLMGVQSYALQAKCGVGALVAQAYRSKHVFYEYIGQKKINKAPYDIMQMAYDFVEYKNSGLRSDYVDFIHTNLERAVT